MVLATGLPEAEFFEAGRHVRPILRRYSGGYRHQARQYPRDQGSEYALTAVLGGNAGIAQFEDLVFGIMPLEQVGIDENEPDDALALIDRDPGFARPPAIADQRIERFLAFECIDEERDLRRQLQQQGVDLRRILKRRRAIGDAGHATSPTRPGRAQTSAASRPPPSPAAGSPATRWPSRC